MSFQKNDIKKIAHLARLSLSEGEIETYQPQLSAILNFIEQLNQADTAAVEPLAHPLDLVARFRNDEVTSVNLRDKYQTIAPKVKAGLYLVPKVIEEA